MGLTSSDGGFLHSRLRLRRFPRAPIGGNVADRIGGVKSLSGMYILAAIFPGHVRFGLPEAWMALTAFVCDTCSGYGATAPSSIGAPALQEIGVMTGLVGMAVA